MNKERRRLLVVVLRHLSIATDLLKEVLDGEKDALSNVPENLQDSERATTMDNAIDSLYDIIDDMNDIAERINDVM